MTNSVLVQLRITIALVSDLASHIVFPLQFPVSPPVCARYLVLSRSQRIANPKSQLGFDDLLSVDEIDVTFVGNA